MNCFPCRARSSAFAPSAPADRRSLGGGRLDGAGTAALVLILLAAATLHGASARSPLADAAEKMDRARVRALVKQHADINAAQPDGMTPLHWAAYHDDLDIAQLLVRAGANVKTANR